MPITAPIKVTSAADATDWTTLAEVKDDLGITVATHDAKLTRYITVASKQLLRFIGHREVAFQHYQETIRGSAETDLMVTRTPIINVIQIQLVNSELEQEDPKGDGADITPDFLIDDAEYGMLYRRGGWLWSPHRGSLLDIRLTAFGDQLPGTEDPNYRIDYEAGYIMPSQTTPVATVQATLPQHQVGLAAGLTFPEDLRQAATEQAKYLFVKRSAVAASGLKIKDVGDTKLEWHHARDREQAATFGLSPDAYYMARPYCRVA